MEQAGSLFYWIHLVTANYGVCRTASRLLAWNKSRPRYITANPEDSTNRLAAVSRSGRLSPLP
ncbi:hypothetical protein HYR99_00955 [Candidatus Poribacteria bacterium]|nr:hypothetical protein [Candidatus Poribacteria bacterium]